MYAKDGLLQTFPHFHDSSWAGGGGRARAAIDSVLATWETVQYHFIFFFIRTRYLLRLNLTRSIAISEQTFLPPLSCCSKSLKGGTNLFTVWQSPWLSCKRYVVYCARGSISAFLKIFIGRSSQTIQYLSVSLLCHSQRRRLQISRTDKTYYHLPYLCQICTSCFCYLPICLHSLSGREQLFLFVSNTVDCVAVALFSASHKPFPWRELLPTIKFQPTWKCFVIQSFRVCSSCLFCWSHTWALI